MSQRTADLEGRLRYEARLARICAFFARKNYFSKENVAFYLALTEVHRNRASRLRKQLKDISQTQITESPR